MRKRFRWILMAGIGALLIVMENYDTEPFFSLFTFIYFMVIFFWIIRELRSLIRLRNEKAKTELLHLKSQVNPHFFFNTLNNLYGWVEKDGKKAQELILKLSDMMRYSIYDGQKDWVTLEEEIDYLKNYTELHRMRYHKEIDIRFNVNIETEGYKVMPLLFIILLENAFKHGVENLRENAYVHIEFNATSKSIQFIVENNFDAEDVREGTGIGLENLKRRLELVYPYKHSLTFSSSGDMYRARLILKHL
ncbi:sensor histidine kinase [Leptobacterium flavescens]|uniref:sensor histidine kinase n=1 Tax=Leptobacterium flavescens TaxID=472055 RepID=UPI001EF9971B|nr:histidine kinase [Leptobacterium flavescens]